MAISRIAGIHYLLLSWLMSCGFEAQNPQPLSAHATNVTPVYSGSFPRFPHNTQAKKLRDVMVFYSPDDIFSNITWKSIGYPDSGFFMIHNAFPKLKITVQIVPENRYLGDIPNRNLERDPVAAQIWRDLFTKPEFRSWLEFGNHGYFHSPPGDENLDHHEFDGNVNAAAHDSAFCYGTFTKARKTYAAIGLDNDRINVMRFPGNAHTPMALRALADHDFLAFFEYRRSGGERFVDLGGNRELQAIPTVYLEEIFQTEALVREIGNGGIPASDLKASEAYRAALANALSDLDALVRSGGIINLFDHWWEHSQPRVNGIRYRFELFKDMLAGLDDEYGERIWWGFGSELAMWSHLKRNVSVLTERDDWGVTLTFEQPAVWKADWSVTAGYTLVLNGSSHHPVPESIHYTLESEGHATKHFLEKEEYWVAGNRLHFNFPFSGTLRIRIAFDRNDADFGE